MPEAPNAFAGPSEFEEEWLTQGYPDGDDEPAMGAGHAAHLRVAEGLTIDPVRVFRGYVRRIRSRGW